MATRTYGQYCAAAKALEVVGDRWTMLLVRELLTGPKRHADLRAGLPGIATNLLSARLRSLQEAGVVTRATLPPPAASAVYELTERGRELKPVLLALARWGWPLLGMPGPDEDFRLAWLLILLEERFDPEAATGAAEDYELRVGGEVLHIVVRDGESDVRDGPAPTPDAVVEADPGSFMGWGAGLIGDDDALAAGVRASGGARTLRRLRELFPIPA